jgi:transposase
MAKKRDYQALERRRRRAAALFDKGLSPAEVARRLNLRFSSVAGKWCRAYTASASEQELPPHFGE